MSEKSPFALSNSFCYCLTAIKRSKRGKCNKTFFVALALFGALAAEGPPKPTKTANAGKNEKTGDQEHTLPA